MLQRLISSQSIIISGSILMVTGGATIKLVMTPMLVHMYMVILQPIGMAALILMVIHILTPRRIGVRSHQQAIVKRTVCHSTRHNGVIATAMVSAIIKMVTCQTSAPTRLVRRQLIELVVWTAMVMVTLTKETHSLPMTLNGRIETATH